MSWLDCRIKDAFTENNRHQPCADVLSLSYGRVILKNTSERKGVVPESYESYQGIHPGDIVLRLTDLQNDVKSLRVGLAENFGIITSAYLSVVQKNGDSRFSKYLLHDLGDLKKEFYSLGGGVRQSMKFADLSDIKVSIPSHPEQRAIDAYLDKATAAIDEQCELIDKKIALLTELRASVIREAVTKGIPATT